MYSSTPDELIDSYNEFCFKNPSLNLKQFIPKPCKEHETETEQELQVETDLQTHNPNDIDEECNYFNPETGKEDDQDEENQETDNMEDEPVLEHTFSIRTVDEAVSIHESIETTPKKERKGFKLLSKQEIELIDSKFDYNTVQRKLTQMKKNGVTLEKQDNPLYKLRNHDVFKNSTVDFMHVFVQGELRRHLTALIEYFSYPRLFSDFQDIIDEFYLSSGESIRMRASNYLNCSADEFLEFGFYSIPIIYKLIYSNKELKHISQEKRTRHVVCWVEHIAWTSMLLRNEVTILSIEKSKSIFLQFREHYVELYPNKCHNVNFHWVTHLFEDCQEWGSPRYFWALLFELKHKLFKKFNDGSNHKDVEKRGAAFEKLHVSLNAKYPWLRKKSKQWFKAIAPNQYLMFKQEGKLYIGCIQSHTKDTVKFGKVWIVTNDYHQVCQFRKLNRVKSSNLNVDWKDINARCQVVYIDSKFYLNQFMLIMNYYKF
ncbi:predicted protein [Naegleria gruberi]|nr:uncharacterized protein NAEGRDRAFT_64044 [Naegleria gruberi]EFC48229.1 predicted protein [Naegleria gruberi]|eukprot:XP_002680973.1 predicted protein [Naegleria gruberi strain NEG-M]